MKYRPLAAGLSAILLATLWAGGAAAATITMSPDPVVLDGVWGSFTLELGTSDDSDNVLNFAIASTSTPAAGIAAILFDGVTVLDAFETSDPDGLVSGIVIASAGAVAGLLLDFGAPSMASFAVQTSSTPTSATLYTIGAWSLPSADEAGRWTGDYLRSLKLDEQRVQFTVDTAGVIPEPDARLSYAAGLALAAGCVAWRKGLLAG
jgi:hypothetical protein